MQFILVIYNVFINHYAGYYQPRILPSTPTQSKPNPMRWCEGVS